MSKPKLYNRNTWYVYTHLDILIHLLELLQQVTAQFVEPANRDVRNDLTFLISNPLYLLLCRLTHKASMGSFLSFRLDSKGSKSQWGWKLVECLVMFIMTCVDLGTGVLGFFLVVFFVSCYWFNDHFSLDINDCSARTQHLIIYCSFCKAQFPQTIYLGFLLSIPSGYLPPTILTFHFQYIQPSCFPCVRG